MLYNIPVTHIQEVQIAEALEESKRTVAELKSEVCVCTCTLDQL